MCTFLWTGPLDALSPSKVPSARRSKTCDLAANYRKTDQAGVEKIDAWLGDGKWDVIHFNWGIHDLKIMADGKRQVEPADYEKNLRDLVAKMKATGAKLIWATTTADSDGELTPPRQFGDVKEYNEIAAKVMKDNGVPIDDLNAAITPQLAKLQNPKDVHYTQAGSEFLAREVAKSLEAALKPAK